MATEYFQVDFIRADQGVNPLIYPGRSSALPYSHQASRKRQITQHCCSRLIESKLPGADLAVDYIYGKYIKNLSVSTIKSSSRVILYFLHFLNRQGTTIHKLTRKDISAYAQYEHDRDLTTQSIVHHLRAVYAFVVFLVDPSVPM